MPLTGAVVAAEEQQPVLALLVAMSITQHAGTLRRCGAHDATNAAERTRNIDIVIMTTIVMDCV